MSVRIERDGGVARIRLDRPQALHALTPDMTQAMLDALDGWRGDTGVLLVMLDHLGERGFCAGGDIRLMAQSAGRDGAEARAFFALEYRLNHRLFSYAKPTLAFMDGVTMGGGAGLALPCRYRVATENTRFAMPETAIGLFPDVGAGWYLSRLPGRIGRYLALTGARLDGAECVALGLATHYLPASTLDAVKAQAVASPGAIEAILAEAAVAPPPAAIEEQREAIDRLFASDDFDRLLADLEADGGDWAREQRSVLGRMAPLSCKVALQLLHEGAQMPTFEDEMAQEYAVATRMVQRPDFAEGVRAVLIDKDGAPRWDPADPAAVTDHMLDRIFAPLDGDARWEPN